jgi:hypothetical protein
MKRTMTMFLLACSMIGFAGMASANTWTPRIDRREARQHARIQEGVRSGELTRGEAMRLRAGQRHVNRMEWRAKSDGRVTFRERARINRVENRQSRHIYRFKHNDCVR